MNQLDTIVLKLQRDGAIDNFWCIDTRLTTRLAAHILKLKKRGWEFRTERDGKNYIYYAIKDPTKYPEVLPQYKVETITPVKTLF